MNRIGVLVAIVLVSVVAVIVAFRSSDDSNPAMASGVLRKQDSYPRRDWKDAKHPPQLPPAAAGRRKGQGPR